MSIFSSLGYLFDAQFRTYNPKWREKYWQENEKTTTFLPLDQSDKKRKVMGE
jgi:hypothetical protein